MLYFFAFGISLLLAPALLSSLPKTMLSQAETLSTLYRGEVAKAAPPSPIPLTDSCLNLASIWFSCDLNTLSFSENETALQMFSQDPIWQALRTIGFDGIRMEHLRKSGQIGIDSKWASNWANVLNAAKKQNISFIGDLIGNATAPTQDFEMAIQNIGDYPNLYQLIEIDSKDWGLLPPIPAGAQETNVPWLCLQELHKKGYVPEFFTPYIKESSWNTTTKITCADGKVRRWIYLKEGENNPVLAWLSPSFAAYRLAAGDALDLTYEQGERILHLDGNIPVSAQETLALWIRKIGAFSAASTNGTFASMQNQAPDLIYDSATQSALLHALIAEDAEALRMIYRLFMENHIDSKRLVHVLQPFDEHACDWFALIHQPKKKFRYLEEQITGEILRKRLLKEDLVRLGSSDKITTTTWVDHCARALKLQDFEKHRDDLTNAHLLLAFAYAMQPGAISLSAADLLGALPNQINGLNLMGPNATTLYSSLPSQLQNPRSFASKLKTILSARRDCNIATGELLAIPAVRNPGTLLLLHRLPQSRFIQLLALNFSRKAVNEAIELPQISKTTAIDLVSKLAEEKVFSSSQFSFTIPPLSGRAFYFQPKYYD